MAEEQKQENQAPINTLGLEANFKKNLYEAGVLLIDALMIEQQLLGCGYDKKRLDLIRGAILDYELPKQ